MKRLNLPSWTLFSRADFSHYTEINPIIGKNGLYLNDDSLCWFEINGLAYLYDKKQFLYELALLSVVPLRQVELDALRLLNKNKLLSRRAMEKLSFYEEWLKITCNERYFAVKGMQARRRFEAFKVRLKEIHHEK